MVSTWIVLLATSTVPVTFTFFPSYRLAFCASSSMYEVLLAASFRMKLSPCFVIVPLNVFDCCSDCCCIELGGAVARPIMGVKVSTSSAPATESTVFFIDHLRDDLWLDMVSSARSLPDDNIFYTIVIA